jgi:hypothetical protein
MKDAVSSPRGPSRQRIEKLTEKSIEKFYMESVGWKKSQRKRRKIEKFKEKNREREKDEKEKKIRDREIRERDLEREI